MDNLSSCYFCGTALDERLREYPVVPDGLRASEDVTTATLCPACHQKLETVLDEVVDAVDGGDATLSATPKSTNTDSDPANGTKAEEETSFGEVTPAEEDASTEEDTPTGDDTLDEATTTADAGETVDDDDAVDTEEMPDTADGSTLEEAETADREDAGGFDEVVAADELVEDVDVAIDANDGDAPGDESSESESDEVTAEDVDALAGDIDSSILEDEVGDAEGESDEESELESAMEPDVPDEFETAKTETDEDDQTMSVADSVADDGVAGAGGSSDDSGGAATDADVSTAMADEAAGDSGGNGDDSSDTSGNDGESGAARTSISALEYNKVMRLLQNREFPVGRDEIETVAANAYGLSQSECAGVIDLAVDRGLIDEDGDQLVRPE